VEGHPDVIKTKVEIAELEKQANDSEGKSDNPGHSNDPPDNPAYITLASQLSSTQAEILSVKRQMGEFNKMADVYRGHWFISRNFSCKRIKPFLPLN